MVFSLLAGCAKTEKATNSQEQTEEPSDSVQQTQQTEVSLDYNDTGVLMLDWWASCGTDSKFESPYLDIQSLYPYMLFGTLVAMDPYDPTNPEAAKMDIAESMQMSDDGLHYTFKIRDDIVWTDGEPLTAKDIEFSYTVNLKIVSSMYAANMTSIKGAQAVIDGEADTVEGIVVEGNSITFDFDVPYVDSVPLLFAALRILPEHLLGDVNPIEFDNFQEYWTKPIGTGAWMIDKVSFPNYFTMVQNPDWYGEPVKIKNITFTSHVTGGVEASVADVIAGNLDYAYGNAVNDISVAEYVVENNPDIEIFIRPSNYQRMFEFNCTSSNDGKWNEAMAIKEVRQAIALLVDKDAIASMYGDAASSLKTACPYTSAWYNTDIPKWERDLKTAVALLDSAGIDKSKPIRISYYYDDQTTKDIMDLITQNFAEAGLTAEPFLMTGDLASIIYDVKNWDIMYSGTLNPNPINLYDIYLPAKESDKYLGDTELRQDEFVPLFDDFKSNTDTVARKEVGDEIQLWAVDNAYTIPLYSISRLALVNTAKLQLDEQVLACDDSSNVSWLFETWTLVSE